MATVHPDCSYAAATGAVVVRVVSAGNPPGALGKRRSSSHLPANSRQRETRIDTAAPRLPLHATQASPFAELVVFDGLLTGSVTVRCMRCGKRRCGCQGVPPPLHGSDIHWTRAAVGQERGYPVGGRRAGGLTEAVRLPSLTTGRSART